MVKVSVVIPVYNEEKYLEEALYSVSNQTLHDIEIICVDDGSTDNSVEILKKYAKEDNRIKIYYQKEPSTDGALARNLGIKKATGLYLSILDSDDFFELDMLEKAYEKAEKNSADIVVYGAYCYNTSLKCDYFTEGYGFAKYAKDIIDLRGYEGNVFYLINPPAWKYLFRRDLIIKNNIEFMSACATDDVAFVMLAAVYAKKIAVDRTRYIHRRIDSEGSLLDQEPSAEEIVSVYIKIREQLIERDIYEEFKVPFVNFVIKTIGDYSIRLLRSYEKYNELINGLKKQWLDDIGGFELSDELLEKDSLIYRNLVVNNSPEEILYKKAFNSNIKRLFYSNELFGLPKNHKQLPVYRVVIYGAGNNGTLLAVKLIKSGEFKLVSWVDRRYEEIGYPIEKPSNITNCEFDYIVIAIGDIKEQQTVRDELIGMGIAEPKIIGIHC